MKKSYGLITETNSGIYNRKRIFNIYMHKFYNLFMGAYRIKGVTEDQQEFILKRFWSTGKIAAFIVDGTKDYKGEEPSVNSYPNGMIAFTDFAPRTYNIYDWPIVVNLVQSRGATFIPSTPQSVNEDCVIGYCQKNKMPVKYIVEYYVSRITDIELTIMQQLKSHKVPWLISTTPENETKVKALFEKLMQDDDALYISADEIEALKVLVTGNTFIIDKLYAQEQAYINDLLTYLGVDNLGQMQKKEHFVVDEVNSNNELINDFGDCFLDTMKSFFERCRTFLGADVDIEAIARPVVSEHDDKGDDEND